MIGNKKLIAIAAVAANHTIGKDGKLPWHIPEDLKFFKRTTLDHTVLMGRKTYDSIIAAIGKPLPRRQSIIISRNKRSCNVEKVISSLQELENDVTLCDKDTVYLLGGAEIYNNFLFECDGLYLTYIKKDYEGDCFFPFYQDKFTLDHIVEETEEFRICYYTKNEI